MGGQDCPPHDRDSHSTRNLLASHHYAQGCFTEAQHLQADLLQDCQESLRYGDSLTMAVMVNLASTVLKIGKMKEACAYHICALELRM